MHFGRLENFKGLDPTLPADSARTEKFLALPRLATTKHFVGCPIWASKNWLGDLYPKGTTANQFLKVYAQTFSTVELNSSFYAVPPPGRVAQWRDDTPPDFRFCPKVFRGITEDLSSTGMPDLVRYFCNTIENFDTRLGLTFAQFSEAFGPNQLPLLERFLSVWPAALPLAVELRHKGWFHEHALSDEVVNLFYRRKVTAVITDTAGKRDVLHLSLTQPKAFIRFQGNEDPRLDEARLREWGLRLKKWAAHSLEEIYFFTHQPGDALIPSTGRLAMREITGVEIPVVAQPAAQLEFL